MGIFDSIFKPFRQNKKEKPPIIEKSQNLPVDMGNNQISIYYVGNKVVINNITQKLQYRALFDNVAELSTIITKLSGELARVGYKIVELDKTGKYIESNSKNATILHELINRPNSRDNWSEFTRNHYIEYFLYGYSIINFMNNGINKKPTKLELLPTFASGLVMKNDRISTDYRINEVDKIYVNGRLMNWTYELIVPAEDCLIEKDIMTEVPYSLGYLSESRISRLKFPAQIVEAIHDSVFSLIHDSTALGILTGKGNEYTMPLPTDIEQVQADMRDKYGMRSDQFKIMLTKAPLDFQKIGIDLKSLSFSELINYESKMIYQMFGYPPQLMNTDASTYNNVSTAITFLWNNSLKPVVDSHYNNISNELTQRFGIENLKIVPDYSTIPELSEGIDMKIDRLVKMKSAGIINNKAIQRLIPDFELSDNEIIPDPPQINITERIQVPIAPI